MHTFPTTNHQTQGDSNRLLAGSHPYHFGNTKLVYETKITDVSSCDTSNLYVSICWCVVSNLCSNFSNDLLWGFEYYPCVDVKKYLLPFVFFLICKVILFWFGCASLKFFIRYFMYMISVLFPMLPDGINGIKLTWFDLMPFTLTFWTVAIFRVLSI
jgi:hypothetical protein